MSTSKVEVVVLGLLAEEPIYGYDLLERFRSRSMGFWVELGKASVYQALRRLERDGSIGGRAQEGREGPDRRVFRITRPGGNGCGAGWSSGRRRSKPYETDGGLALGFVAPAAGRRTARKAWTHASGGPRPARRPPDRARPATVAGQGAGRSVSTAMLDRQDGVRQGGTRVDQGVLAGRSDAAMRTQV